MLDNVTGPVEPIEPPRRGRGQPSKFTEKLAKDICDRLSGGESLRGICRMEGYPNIVTVMRWISRNEEFRKQYVHARELQAEFFMDEIIEIADDGSNDYMEKLDAEGAIVGWRENGEFISRSRTRIEARKWAISKLAPKKYGDKLQVDMPNGGMSTLNQTINIVQQKDPIESMRAYQEIIGLSGDE